MLQVLCLHLTTRTVDKQPVRAASMWKCAARSRRNTPLSQACAPHPDPNSGQEVSCEFVVSAELDEFLAQRVLCPLVHPFNNILGSPICKTGRWKAWEAERSYRRHEVCGVVHSRRMEHSRCGTILKTNEGVGTSASSCLFKPTISEIHIRLSTAWTLARPTRYKCST